MPLQEISANIRRAPVNPLNIGKPGGSTDVPPAKRGAIIALCKLDMPYSIIAAKIGVAKSSISRIYAKALSNTSDGAPFIDLIQCTDVYRANCGRGPIIEPGTQQHFELRAAFLQHPKMPQQEMAEALGFSIIRNTTQKLALDYTGDIEYPYPIV